MCIKNKMRIEYNLSGKRFPIGRPFPSRSIISQLINEGCKFFVGSDSHSLDYFESQITKVKDAYIYLNSIKNQRFN